MNIVKRALEEENTTQRLSQFFVWSFLKLETFRINSKDGNF
jgi:hypothetical protein